MTHITFDDKSKPPTQAALTEALGRARKLWDELIHHLDQEYAPVTREWSFYQTWSLRLKRKQRTITYLLPRTGHFVCAFVFGGKATAQARRAGLPRETMQLINAARVYAEGRGFRLEVRNRQDLETIKQLAALKMAN